MDVWVLVVWFGESFVANELVRAPPQLRATVQPLQIAHCKDSKRDYLLCDYNRDADSYRSPWSNKVRCVLFAK